MKHDDHDEVNFGDNNSHGKQSSELETERSPGLDKDLQNNFSIKSLTLNNPNEKHKYSNSNLQKSLSKDNLNASFKLDLTQIEKQEAQQLTNSSKALSKRKILKV